MLSKVLTAIAVVAVCYSLEDIKSVDCYWFCVTQPKAEYKQGAFVDDQCICSNPTPYDKIKNKTLKLPRRLKPSRSKSPEYRFYE